MEELELSIEEKAERYDEVFKIVKDAQTYHYDDREQLKKIESILYEPKGDEDERIRRELISFIQEDIDEINLKVSGDYDDRDADDIAHETWCKKAIDWLKRGGEQKQDTSIQINPAEYINDMGGNGCCLKNTVQSSTWTKEDKKMLSDIVDCLKNLPIFYASLNINGEDKTAERFICDALNWLRSIEGRVQQQEWSEEDEEILEDIRFNFGYNKGKMTDALIAQYGRFFDKIKYLKPQPKQVWSEEDLYKLEHALFGTYAVDSATRLLNKIKFLNSQNTWRPSDEQIEALESATENCAYSEYQDCLRELIEQLKKLKE